MRFVGEVKLLGAARIRFVAPAEIHYDSSLRRYMMVYSPFYNNSTSLYSLAAPFAG